MANDVRSGGIRPGAPASPAPLRDKGEQSKIGERPSLPGALSVQDAARIAQQAGFQRGPKKRRGLDMGDASHAPIPLPEEESAGETWGPERLDEAQQKLSLASAQLGAIATGAPEQSLAESLAEGSFLPTEEGVAELQRLVDGAAPDPLVFENVTASMKDFFGLELGEGVPVGQRLLAAGLVVAGEADALAVSGEGLDEQRLVAGLQKISERSNHAIGEAQKMSRGIHRERTLQRTFVGKR